MEHVQAHTMRLLDTVPAGTMKSSAVHFQPGDVLYGRLRPYLNKVYRPDFEGLASAEFIVFPNSRHFDSRFLQYFLNSAEFVSFATHLNTGDRPRVDYDQLAPYPVPLPPLDEQQRIVAAIEEQFTRLDAAVAGLKRTQANLKRYRAAVLAAACSGRLVPTEAEQARQEGREYEPADQLLQRILSERRERWEADQLARMQAQGKVPNGDAWKNKYADSDGVEDKDLPDLPDGWVWTTIEQLGFAQGGIQKQPKRRPQQHAFPFLRVANVLRGRLDLSEIHEVELFAGELEKLRLEPDDLLIVEGNGSPTEIGRMAVWNGSIPNCVHQNHIIRVRPLTGALAKYIESYWNSPVGSNTVMRVASSTSGLYTLSVSKINQLPVPLPPYAEQVRVVNEVDHRLSLSDVLHRSTEHALKRADRLRQSILRRAFEGTLVPQDPTDEPAEVLLERIRVERAASSPNGTQRKPRARNRNQQPLFDLQEVGETA